MKKSLRTVCCSLMLATALVSQNSVAKDDTASMISLGSIISVAIVTSPIWKPFVISRNSSDTTGQAQREVTNAEVAFANQEKVVVDAVHVQDDTAQWVFKRNDNALIEIETPRPTQSTLPEAGQVLVVNQTDLGIVLTQEDTVWFYFYNQKGFNMLNSQKL